MPCNSVPSKENEGGPNNAAKTVLPRSQEFDCSRLHICSTM